MGRPAKQPSDQDRAQVETWVAARVPIQVMARRIGLAPKTFRKHFARELGLIAADQVAEAMPPGVVIDPPRPPAFRATDEQKEWVIILSGARWPNDDIAAQLQMPLEVLEEHFANELELGPVRFPAEAIKSAWYAARGGNQTAVKTCLIMNGRETPGGPPGRGKGSDVRSRRRKACRAKRPTLHWRRRVLKRVRPLMAC
jgi:hypothetical protein